MKRKIDNIKDAKNLMTLAIYAGKLLVKNGAEIYRVEDTMQRICSSATNIDSVDVYVLTSGIFISLEYDGEIMNNFKKVKSSTINLEKIAEVNDFSRKFVSDNISYNEGMNILEKIDSNFNINSKVLNLSAGWLAGFFSLLFGGNIKDFISAFLITTFVSHFLNRITKFDFTFFVYNFIGSFIITVLAILFTKINLASNYNMVVIGSIMILVPGVPSTNAARDIMNGDFLSGLMGLAKTIFLGLAIALGVGAALQILK
ncbi:threonine/serine ThrE exporter family protein [Anaerosphaera multitolerans]|uniref:Threonine/serine exporter n=1 Tax=Anaerosphaera multitolerans TaxID=2487351 RepID=A0A437S7X3_9FIRM|nr:threonine/serine exporter family protein [Anaerosphaera multitolerans]RVU55175.1 threonine/serine exporter [Anaerosphaera multitolerans]